MKKKRKSQKHTGICTSIQTPLRSIPKLTCVFTRISLSLKKRLSFETASSFLLFLKNVSSFFKNVSANERKDFGLLKNVSGFFWEIFLIGFHQWWDKAALPFFE